MIRMSIIKQILYGSKPPKFIGKNGAFVASSSAAAVVPLNVAHACIRYWNRERDDEDLAEYTVIEVEVQENETDTNNF